MSYLLDTNICIYLLNGRYPKVEKRLLQCGPNEVSLSSIVLSELRFGASKSEHAKRNHKTLDAFVSGFSVLDYDYDASVAYGEIRSALESKGKPIGSEDTFIAAHCVGLGLTLVTNNQKHFARVPGLKTENWAK